jgi:hypothetical protein
VPKLHLVAAIHAQLNNATLIFAQALTEGEALKRELQNFQHSVTAAGRSVFEHRSGEHDDLVFSIAMPLWLTQEQYRIRINVGHAVGVY